MSKDKAVGFFVYVDGIKYELVENYFGWSVYIADDEIFCGGRDSYRRALQIILNRIGVGDLY